MARDLADRRGVAAEQGVYRRQVVDEVGCAARRPPPPLQQRRQRVLCPAVCPSARGRAVSPPPLTCTTTPRARTNREQRCRRRAHQSGDMAPGQRPHTEHQHAPRSRPGGFQPRSARRQGEPGQREGHDDHGRNGAPWVGNGTVGRRHGRPGTGGGAHWLLRRRGAATRAGDGHNDAARARRTGRPGHAAKWAGTRQMRSRPARAVPSARTGVKRQSRSPRTPAQVGCGSIPAAAAARSSLRRAVAHREVARRQPGTRGQTNGRNCGVVSSG